MAKKTTTPTQEEAANAISKMFVNASLAPAPKAKKTTAENRDTIQLDNLKVIAAANIVKEAMEAIMDSEKKAAKQVCMDHFLQTLNTTKKKPETMNAEQGAATAQIVFVASAFADKDTADLMDNNKVPYEKKETTPARFVINPEIYDNQDLLAKLAIALANLKGFEGIEIIQRQNPIWKIGVTEATFEATANIKDASVQAKIFQDISNMQFKKPQLDDTNSLQAAVDFLQAEGLVNLENKAKAKTEKTEKKAKKK